jgi:hypothetical protein
MLDMPCRICGDLVTSPHTPDNTNRSSGHCTGICLSLRSSLKPLLISSSQVLVKWSQRMAHSVLDGGSSSIKSFVVFSRDDSELCKKWLAVLGRTFVVDMRSLHSDSLSWEFKSLLAIHGVTGDPWRGSGVSGAGAVLLS